MGVWLALLFERVLSFFTGLWFTTVVAYPHPHQLTRAVTSKLPSQVRLCHNRPVLVLDLDETLVHTTLKRCQTYDTRIDVWMNDTLCEFYVFKRPHVELFLRSVTQWFDVVVFTASLQSYADPVIDFIDPDRIIKRRLFRESCVEMQGNFVKDLAVIGHDLSQILIIDNSPIAYSLNPHNALPIETWTYDPEDEELLNLLPFLAGMTLVADVRSILSLRTSGPLGSGGSGGAFAGGRSKAAVAYPSREQSPVIDSATEKGWADSGADRMGSCIPLNSDLKSPTNAAHMLPGTTELSGMT